MASGPRRHRGLFAAAFAVAVAALVGGSVMAVRAYRATASPAAAVTGYFAALQRADAPAALGFGELPPGPRSLLTSPVLAAQQRIAPIRAVSVVSVDQTGSTATVAVTYTLGFAGGTRTVQDRVPVIYRGHAWRLTRTAALTQLHLAEAVDRASILGAGVPDGAVLLFPGAVPIGFDTPYLQLDAASSIVTLSGSRATDPSVQLSAPGRTAMLAAVATALRACLGAAGTPDPRCPVPSDRYVPGSLRGSFSGADLARLSLGVTADPAGVVRIGGAPLPVTGTYQVLDFNNQPLPGSGTVALPLSATSYAVAPITVNWAGPQ